ncbi:MAG: H4MPT-linked C1 transfer pathway protein [Candidatus Nezhaarchaeota archaeon]|nr:H4MPT-linked C1 transfer pathway protein [Candidatus Nezhaarchaeota archaeon]
MKALGVDVGGVNLKAALVSLEERGVKIYTRSRYLPVWKVGKKGVEEGVKGLASWAREVDAVAVTMTAELSDLYFVKREGVNHVLDCVEASFKERRVGVVNVKAELVSIEEARSRFMEVAAANWAASGWLAGRIMDTCVLIDVGSTTTTITPVVKGRPAARGLNDLEKLTCGELVYTGALRTNVAALAKLVPLRSSFVRVSPELFAITGDVHVVLGHISPSDYTVDTPDGRGVTRREALARLARVVCADIEALSEEEVVELARFLYRKQVEEVADAIQQVYGRLEAELGFKPPALTCGLGASFIAERALSQAGVASVKRLSDYVGNAAKIATALGAALMALSCEGHEPVLQRAEVYEA